MRRPRSSAQWSRALLPALVATAACLHDGTQAPRDAAPIRGVDFLARIAVVEKSPTRLTGEIQVTNRRDTLVVLMFPDDCVAMLRAYETVGARVAPVWDQRETTECDGEPTRIEIGAGAVAAFRIPEVEGGAILRDSLPPGVYRFTAYLRPDGRVIEVEAGTVEL